MNQLKESFKSVHHGMAMGLLALILGALWAAYMATHHESLHGAFEDQQAKAQKIEMNRMMEGMDMDGMSMGHTHEAEKIGSDADGHAHAAEAQHSHSGSLATDAMQRLLRGHIHFMGIGLLSILMLVMVAATTLKSCWKKVFGWTFGLGSLLYPPAWILMGFRTVELGPQAAEASVLWLFGPAVGLLLGSLVALFAVLAIECTSLNKKANFSWLFNMSQS